jgi:hypothetical protein
MMLPANQKVLARRYPELLALLEEWRGGASPYRLVVSVEGELTLLVRLDDGTEISLSELARSATAHVSQLGARPGQSVLCLGFGLGRHVRALLDAVGPRGQVQVVLLQPLALLAALRALDLSALLADPRCTLIWGDIAAIGRRLSLEDALVYYHDPSLRAADDALRPLVAAVERLRTERLQVARCGPVVEENYRRNLGWIAAARGLDDLAGRLRGWPAVVIAAGPSLDRNVDQLRALQGRAALLCVDTAVRRLAQAGVRPDLVLTVDPNRASLHHFVDADPTLPLAFLPSAYSEVLNAHRGPKIVALPRGDRLAERLQQLSGKGLVGVGGTVTYFGIEVACRLGCATVIFVGLDLALTGGATHCSAARSAPAEASRRLVAAVDGGVVATTPTLDRFRKTIELRIAEDRDRVFVDASEGGARIEGTIVCSLAEAKARWCRDLPELPQIFGNATPSAAAVPASWLEAWSEINRPPAQDPRVAVAVAGR